MRILLLVIAITTLSGIAQAQYDSNQVRKVASLPATCTVGTTNNVVYNGVIYQCTATNTWKAHAPSGQLPTSTYSGLPTCSSSNDGQLYRVTDTNRDVYSCYGTAGKWISRNGGVYDVRDFGAKGDGSADDATAIQAAEDAAASAATSMYTPVVRVPGGTYMLGSTVSHRSYVSLEGESYYSAIFKAKATFTGTALIDLKLDLNASTTHSYSSIRGLQIDTTNKSTLIGITPIDRGGSPGSWNNLVVVSFRDLFFKTALGMDFSGALYCQDVIIDNIRSEGAVDKLLYLSGNFNTIKNVFVEGNAAATVNPVVKLLKTTGCSGCLAGNLLEHINIEPSATTAKPGFAIDGNANIDENTVINMWIEMPGSLGPALSVQNTGTVKFKGILALSVTNPEIYARSTELISIDSLSIDGLDQPLSSTLDIDSTANLHIHSLYSRRALGAFPLSTLSYVTVDNHYERTSPTVDSNHSGIHKAVLGSTANLLSNGSFEQEGNAWVANPGTHATYSYQTTASPLGNKSFRMSSFTGSSDGIYQNITVTAGMVNYPLVVSGLLRHQGTGRTVLNALGLGISTNTGSNYVDSTTGWQFISFVVTPTSSGTLQISISTSSADGTTTVDADGITVSPGTTGLFPAQSGDVVIGIHSITYASSIPTWSGRQGDIVLNSGSTANGTFGWQNTSGSSTWVALTARNSALVTATTSGSVSLDFSTGLNRELTLSGNITSLTGTNIPTDTITIAFIQDGTGSRTLTGWNSLFKFAGGVVPTLSTTAGARDQFTFQCNGTNCYLLSVTYDVK